MLAQHVEQVARAEHLQRLRAVRAHLRHEPQPAPDHLLRQDLRLGGERAQPQHDRHVAHVPALAQHHHAHDRLDPAAAAVDVARGLPRLFQVSLPHFAGGVGVDHQYLGRLESCGRAEILAQRVGVDVLLRHDEEHRLDAERAVRGPMLLPPPYRGLQPIAVLRGDVVLGHPLGVVRRLPGVVLVGDDDRRLDDPVLHRLRQRVVAHRPREVHAVPVLGRGREVEPGADPLRQRAVNAEQRPAPGQFLVVHVMRLVVHHHQIRERLDPFQHGTPGGPREVLRRFLSQQRLDGVRGSPGIVVRLVELVDVGEKQIPRRRGFGGLAAQDHLLGEAALPLRRNQRQPVEDIVVAEVPFEPLIDDHVGGDDEEVGGEFGVRHA